MRWTKNDSLAYQAVSDAGEKLRGLYDQYLAGQAYNTGATQEELPQYAPADEFDTGGYITGQKYGLGGKVQDTEFTPQERRRAGLQSQGDYWAKRGDATKANALYDQADQMELRGMQLNSAKDAEAQRTKLRAFESKWNPILSSKDPIAALKQIAPEYNANEGAYKDGHYVAFASTPQGEMVTRFNPETGKASAAVLTPELATRALERAYMLERAGLGVEGFDKLVGYNKGLRDEARNERKDKSDATYKSGMLGVAQQNANTQEQYRKDMARLYGQRAANAGTGKGGNGQILGFEGDSAVILRNGKIAIEPLKNEDGSPMDAKSIAWFKKAYAGGEAPKPAWKLSNDGSYRSNDVGDVEDWDAAKRQWAPRGVPPVSEKAARAGVRVARVGPGKFGFVGAGDIVYDNDAEAAASFASPASRGGLQQPMDYGDTGVYSGVQWGEVNPLSWLIRSHPDNLNRK